MKEDHTAAKRLGLGTGYPNNKAQQQCCTCLKLIYTFLAWLILVLTFKTLDYPCDVIFESCSYCITRMCGQWWQRLSGIGWL